MLKGAVIYLLSNSFNKGLPFLLLPLLTLYLDTEAYGTLAIFQVYLAVAVALIGMLMQANISKNYFRQEKKWMQSLIGNMYLLLGSNMVILLVVVGLVITFWPELLALPHKWLLVIPVIAFFQMSAQFNLTLLRNQQAPFKFAGFEMATGTLQVIATLVLVVFLAAGWQGQAMAVGIAWFSGGSAGFVYLYKKGYINLRWSQDKIKNILALSLPSMPHAVGSIAITLSDRLFLDTMIGREEVGVYSVGYQFGMIILLLSDSGIKAWSPWFYKKMATINAENKQLIVRYSYLFVGGLGLGAVCLSIVGPIFINSFLSVAYHKASLYIPWVAASYVCRAGYSLLFAYLVDLGKTKVMGIVTTLATGLNFLGNYYLINLNGAIGAAQATLVAYAFMFIVVFVYVNRIFPMPWLSPLGRIPKGG